MYSYELIHRNFLQVQESIAQAALRSGRIPSSVKLVVVTKSHPVEAARAAIQSGAKFLGENYAEEGVEKIRTIGDMPGIEWHMIGHIQSRKADLVVRQFTLIHSLDSYKLAERINRTAEAIQWTQPVLIQINVSGEESKFGYPAWQDDQLPALFAEIEKVITLPSIEIRGVMTVPPYSENGENSRSFFKRLGMIRDRLASVFPSVNWTELSMGMSADFEIAVEEGATLVRIGTAILGERDYSKG
jgi:pyridoxal phosphate enzyme (YggS family)